MFVQQYVVVPFIDEGERERESVGENIDSRIAKTNR
jgi:hypothetical protein